MSKFNVIAILIACSLFFSSASRADDFSTSMVNLAQPDSVNSSDALVVFGGRMSTTSLGSTFVFNVGQRITGPAYDNYIAGLAYDHDFWRFRDLLVVGAEVGVANRFGHYVVCCDILVVSPDIVQSWEAWGGLRLRYQGIVLFNELRVAPAATLGLSATTNSIGRERDREITQGGNARLLFYFGPEVALSLRGHERIELVVAVHHRSGGERWLGHLEEGYNANTLGLRFRF
jgi:hypothetical protein